MTDLDDIPPAETGGYTRPVEIASIPARGKTVTVSFPADALEAVARRLDAEAVKSLQGSFTLGRKDELITVSGEVSADLVRICVTSLQEMDEHVADSFDFEMEQVDTMPDFTGELEMEADAPDPFIGDTIDLAELAIQHVSLAMDPFPRKEGAEPVKDEGEQPSLSPFSVLKSMKDD